MKYLYGNVAWVKPGYAGQDPEDWSAPPYIEHRFPLTSAFHMAKALWRVAGQAERADQISNILSRAIERAEAVRDSHPWVLDDADIAELVPLVSELSSALANAGLEDRFRIPMERLPEFREKYPELDLEPEGIIVPQHLDSTVAYVDSLAEFLQGARARQLHVYFDFER